MNQFTSSTVYAPYGTVYLFPDRQVVVEWSVPESVVPEMALERLADAIKQWQRRAALVHFPSGWDIQPVSRWSER